MVKQVFMQCLILNNSFDPKQITWKCVVSSEYRNTLSVSLSKIKFVRKYLYVLRAMFHMRQFFIKKKYTKAFDAHHNYRFYSFSKLVRIAIINEHFFFFLQFCPLLHFVFLLYNYCWPKDQYFCIASRLIDLWTRKIASMSDLIGFFSIAFNFWQITFISHPIFFFCFLYVNNMLEWTCKK